MQGEGQAAHRPMGRAGIAEADILEHEALADRVGDRDGAGGGGDFGRDLEEIEQVVEVKRLCGGAGEGQQKPLQQGAEALERPGEEGQIADADGARQGFADDPQIGDVIAKRADGGEDRAPSGAGLSDAAALAVEALGQGAVAVGEEGVQVEDLDFFGGFRLGRDLADIVQLAPFGSAAEIQRVVAGVEMRLAQECRDQRHQQQHDQPRIIGDQPAREGQHGQDVLHLPEDLAHQGHAARGLTAGAVQLVLEGRVLEILQIQVGCMFHQIHGHGDGQPFRQQRVDQPDQPPQQVRGDGQPEFQRDQPGQMLGQPAGPPFGQRLRPVEGDQPDHLVDDQLADPQRRDRHQGPQQAQDDGGGG